MPRLSVGLAVYNGERFLAEALESILAQTLPDFELIISDNASTDRTEAICREFAARDPRIRYHRNATNIGGANNENQTFRMARGEYFRLAADDDVCEPTLFEKCVEVLDRDRDVVLCHSVVTEIDERGDPIRVLDRNKGDHHRPSERFRQLIRLDYNCEETYGVLRSDVLRRTDLQRNYSDSDRTLLAELGLYGRFHQVPEALFSRRIHPGMSTQVYRDWWERLAWFEPERSDRLFLPHWAQFFHYLRIIRRAPIPLVERVRCYRHMAWWLLNEWHGRWMVKDVLLATRKVLRRAGEPFRRSLRTNGERGSTDELAPD